MPLLVCRPAGALLLLKLLSKMPRRQIQLVALVQLQARLQLLLLMGPERKLQAQPCSDPAAALC